MEPVVQADMRDLLGTAVATSWPASWVSPGDGGVTSPGTSFVVANAPRRPRGAGGSPLVPVGGAERSGCVGEHGRRRAPDFGGCHQCCSPRQGADRDEHHPRRRSSAGVGVRSRSRLRPGRRGRSQPRIRRQHDRAAVFRVGRPTGARWHRGLVPYVAPLSCLRRVLRLAQLGNCPRRLRIAGAVQTCWAEQRPD
jgi:hypothetical protein